MPSHNEKRFMPYSKKQLFELVSDVESYPEFLPWCLGLKIINRKKNVLYADMVVGFSFYREKFTSKIVLESNRCIKVEYLDGPFNFLENRWSFKKQEGGCEVCFYINFEFKSRILKKIMQPMFYEAVRRMVVAFEKRAEELYGKK
tara:strand:+ start:616 stop:1050 length:435 start_codon:yes stop_codon:yes gene_type:complete